MNLFFKELFRHLDPKKKGFKRKLLSFAFFLSLSTAFWFLNALGEKYSENISYPIKYINLPEHKVSSFPLPEKLNLNVTTSGYDLLQYYLSANINPVIIDYKSKNINSLKGNKKYIVPKNITQNITHAISNLTINSIYPDTIKFQFYQIVRKKVPIQALVTYKLKEGFIEKGEMQCIPDSVYINGPEKEIKFIDKIYTGKISLGEISEDSKRNVALKTIKGITYDKYRTNVLIPIEQSTEKIIELPIQIDNQIDNASIKLIPNHINLRYKVGLSEFNNITPDLFYANVIYSDSTKNSDVLQVLLTQHPNKIYEIEFTPNFVEYIIEQK